MKKIAFIVVNIFCFLLGCLIVLTITSGCSTSNPVSNIPSNSIKSPIDSVHQNNSTVDSIVVKIYALRGNWELSEDSSGIVIGSISQGDTLIKKVKLVQLKAIDRDSTIVSFFPDTIVEYLPSKSVFTF